MLIEKNQMLDELLQRIDNGGDTGQITRSTVIELKNQIRAHASEEDEWHKFRAHFEQVHPGFFIRLKEMHPALTEYELRLCAYIRTGMYGKQIAICCQCNQTASRNHEHACAKTTTSPGRLARRLSAWNKQKRRRC